MNQEVIWQGDTAFGHFEVVDTLYDGRPARVLYSGNRHAAQSGIATDDNPDLLFDYNQRLFELATSLQPARILLLGGAVGTLPTALLAALPKTHIDVVELDEGLTQLGYRYFDLPVSERLQIFHTDGRSFLRQHTGKYDMVIVDVFIHTAIPRDMRTGEAFAALAAHTATGGVLAMNVISVYYGKSSHILRSVYAAAMQSFTQVDIFLASHGFSLWLPQNFVLAAQKASTQNLDGYMRHDAVAPPEGVTSEEVLKDE